MDTLVDLIKTIILARASIGVALIVAVLAATYANRHFVRDVWHDPDAFWRVIARLAALATAALLAWVTLFDDWLQLVAEPYRLAQKWEYRRVVWDPVDPAVRAITVALIVVALVTLAMLFARHIGGYLLQAGTLVLAALVWIPVYIMNQRLNVMIVQGAETTTALSDALGLAAFWVVRIGLGVLTIGVTLLTGMMLIALVATVLLDLTRMRHPRVTHEADGFFSELGKRAEVHEDIPLRSFWRPIRRPL